MLDFHGYVPSRRQSRVSELYTERGSNMLCIIEIDALLFPRVRLKLCLGSNPKAPESVSNPNPSPKHKNNPSPKPRYAAT